MARPSPFERPLPAGVFALGYALAAGAWIVWSDRLLWLFGTDPKTVERLSIAKGFLFVAVTGLLLWGALRRQLRLVRAAEQEVREANDRLQRTNVQLRALAARLQQVREEEKARIARDLHDELGQLLTGLSMDLDWLEGRLEAMPAGQGASALVDRAVAASELARQTVAEVQRIAGDLRPASLDRLGLGEALREEGRRFARRASIGCEVRLDEPLPALPTGKATALYRIAQEALTNVARHARARHVAIRLGVREAIAELEVSDDGVGLDPALAADPVALGLASMRERATMEGGEVTFERQDRGGTRVRARIPLGSLQEVVP
ncbi:MAG: sensor histidine kinase [Anaeromyxobacteraceae bacterium]